MTAMTDRRHRRTDRRRPDLVNEALSRRRERRDHDDRRESPRYETQFFVNADDKPVRGEISLGGGSFPSTEPSLPVLTIHFYTPDADLSLAARVTHVTRSANARHIHFEFIDLSLEEELAIARWMDFKAAGIVK